MHEPYTERLSVPTMKYETVHISPNYNNTLKELCIMELSYMSTLHLDNTRSDCAQNLP